MLRAANAISALTAWAFDAFPLGAAGFSYVFRVLGVDDLMIATLARFGIDTK
jgi:hypothetical protein